MEVSFGCSRRQRWLSSLSLVTATLFILYPALLCAQEDPPLPSAEGAAPTERVPLQASSSANPFGFNPEVLSSLANAALPALSQLLNGSGGEGGASDGAGLESLQDLGKKAANSLSLSSTSARENFVVPANELFGALKDLLGDGADDGRGVQVTARMLMPLQLPLLQLAGERIRSTDAEEDRKALKIVTETPSAKK